MKNLSSSSSWSSLPEFVLLIGTGVLSELGVSFPRGSVLIGNLHMNLEKVRAAFGLSLLIRK